MRKTLLASALLALALASASGMASASTLFSTADLNDFSTGYENGAYAIDNTSFIGSSFHLDSASDISAIGGYFSQYSDGTIFGAILASGAAWNTMAGSALAEVTFAGSGADQFVNLSGPLHLAAGDYQLVFGSGLFGATGSSALVDSQYTLGTPNIQQSFNAGNSLSALSTPDVRMTVLGAVSPAPEAESYAMFLAGLGLVGAMVRRRRPV